MLAQSMVAPLRRRLDHESISRRTLLVDPLPEGALPNYNIEPLSIPRKTHERDLALWVQPGAWAIERQSQTVARIEEINCPEPGVRVQVWRSPEPPSWIDVDYFYENWEPCEEPAEPRDFWRRLEEEDFLSDL